MLGVCDCCDGSDESANGHVVNCTNYCAAVVSALKHEALSTFRDVQAGRRARAELLQVEKRKKLLELKNYETLLAEKQEMTNMYVTIKLWLRREEPLENKERLKLVRERESRCGFGDEDACNLFHKGWLPADQLMYGGIEAIFANPRVERHYFPTFEQLQEQRRLSGLARVRYSLCMETDLLPDETTRIFDTLGEYESFYSGPGGKVATRKTVGQMRRDSLFGPYLEHGHQGYMEGLSVIAEILGVLASPIIVPLQLSMVGVNIAANFIWEQADKCARNEESMEPIRSVCIFVAHMNDEGSAIQAILNLLDITLFNEVQSYVLEFVQPIIRPPLWLFSVMWGTPKMLYDYYWLGLMRQLPARRNCCLLREGESALLKELDAVNVKIAEYESKQLSSSGPVSTATPSGERLAALSEASKKKKPTATDIDFGSDNSWELVNGDCVEENIGKYKYRFCFFGNVKQGSTLLGNFLGWGTRADLTQLQSPVDESDEADAAKKKRNKNKNKVKWEFPANYATTRRFNESYYTTQVQQL
jgi:hypothetical protein